MVPGVSLRPLLLPPMAAGLPALRGLPPAARGAGAVGVGVGRGQARKKKSAWALLYLRESQGEDSLICIGFGRLQVVTITTN